MLELYGKRMAKYHQRVRESAFEKKDGIRMAQDGTIEWTEFLRFSQGLVLNSFDEEKLETAVEMRRRYLDSDLAACSDPD